MMNEIVGRPAFLLFIWRFGVGRTKEKACRSFLLRYQSCKDIFGYVRGRASKYVAAASNVTLEVNLA
jgi:hypothetical protein